MAELNKARRERIKLELLGQRGGKCIKCGYHKTLSALCFHHRDPSKKEFNISGEQLTKLPRKKLENEADKCDVYCMNCHAEFHDKEGWVHENGKRTPRNHQVPRT